MNILITGGAGFIGINFLKKLLKKKYKKVLVIDSLDYASNKKYFLELKEENNFFFEKCKIQNKNKIKQIIKNFAPNIIYNFAAETHVDNSILNPKVFLDTNIYGVYSLLESIREIYSNKKYKNFKLIHISTDEVFGDVVKKSNELTAYNPSSPYSASKASSDFLVKSWGRTFGIPYIITNCSNNYGPFQHQEKFIPKIIDSILKKKNIPVYGNGLQKRDWLFVEDHVEALLKLVNSKIKFQTFNIGTGNEITNIKIIKIIISIMEQEYNFTDLKKLIKHVDDRLGHDVRYSIDNKKFKNQFNWNYKFSIDKGIRKTIKWYMDNHE